MEDKLDFAGRNPLLDSPKCSSFSITDNVFTSPTSVHDIFNFSQNEDFGRESLGCLHIDFGRESDIFNLNSLEAGRESLGILNLNNLDVGRDSLGITNINTYDFVLSKASLPTISESNANIDSIQKSSSQTFLTNTNYTLPEMSITKASDDSVSSILNTGFLQQRLPSDNSNSSSIFLSFNSTSLGNLPSMIYSSSASAKTDIMNESFQDTLSFLKRMRHVTMELPIYTKNNLQSIHNRIKSLPANLEEKNEDFVNLSLNGDLDRLHEKEIEQCTSSIAQNADCDDKFNDSVFIEARHIASKIQDGSFFEPDLAEDMLDCFEKPEAFENISIENESLKSPTQTVFKNIDKMFTPTKKCDYIESEYSNKSVQEAGNFSYSSNKSKRSNSKSKEASEILNTLSEFVNSALKDEKKKAEGQHLLNNLADVLSDCHSRSSSYILDDSGHSSGEHEAAATQVEHCYEIIDLRKKNSLTDLNEVEDCAPLDLSLKSKSVSEKTFLTPKCLPPRLIKNPQKSLINFNPVNIPGINNNKSKSLNDLSNKLKPKKCDAKASAAKRGPMKAIIPINNMARKSTNLKVTPTRSEVKTLPKINKTSTPINESHLKPVAQSTPDNPPLAYFSSPVARTKSSDDSKAKIPKQKLNYSGTNSLNSSRSNSLLKRASSGELRKPHSTLVRSYSADGKSGFKHNNNSKHSHNNSKTDGTPVLKENRFRSSLCKLPLTRKSGKENEL